MIVQILYEDHLNPVFEITMVMMAVYNYFPDHRDQSWQAGRPVSHINIAGLLDVQIF